MVVRKSTGTKAAVSGGVASLSSPASELGAGGPASLCRVPLLAPGAVSVSSVVTAAWPSLSLSLLPLLPASLPPLERRQGRG